MVSLEKLCAFVRQWADENLDLYTDEEAETIAVDFCRDAAAHGIRGVRVARGRLVLREGDTVTTLDHHYWVRARGYIVDLAYEVVREAEEEELPEHGRVHDYDSSEYEEELSFRAVYE